MKKTKFLLLSLFVISVLALTFSSCKKDDPVEAPTVSIFSTVDGYQVAFTATATNADTYAWGFGDTETSTDQNPTHIYAQSGSYTATLTVTGEGGTATATETVTIAASELEMLTGGPAMANGKAWVFSSVMGEGDAIYKNTADFELDGPLADGMLGLIGLTSEYDDEFTFKYDLTYTHDAKNDSVITDIIYAMINQIPFRTSAEDVIVLAPFTPAAATFTYTEDTDLTLEVTSDEANDSTWNVTWSNVTILEIAGGTEFIGIQDFTRKYLITDIGTDHVQIGMFVSATEGTKMNYPSHMIRMTFVPKD